MHTDQFSDKNDLYPPMSKYDKEEDDIENLGMRNKMDLVNEDEMNAHPETGFQKDIDEEMAEPDISYWCKDSPDASSLLRECIEMMNKRNWKAMISKLKSTVIQNDAYTSTGDENIINKASFVKNFYLGVAYFKEGDHKSAYESFNEAKKLYQYYQLHYNIALCLMKEDRLDEAAEFLEAVITKNPNFFFAHYNLIRINLKKRTPSAAYVLYRRLSDVKIYKFICFS